MIELPNKVAIPLSSLFSVTNIEKGKLCVQKVSNNTIETNFRVLYFMSFQVPNQCEGQGSPIHFLSCFPIVPRAGNGGHLWAQLMRWHPEYLFSSFLHINDYHNNIINYNILQSQTEIDL